MRQAAVSRMTASPEAPHVAMFLAIARDAGCPEDQVRSFLASGYVPQPKQMQFHAAARLADFVGKPDLIGFGGARGPGKSHASFAQICLDDCQRRDGLKVLFLRRIGKAARESFEDLSGRILRYAQHQYRRQEGILTFPNGSRVVLGHFKNENDIDNYLGIEYDVICLEEATSLTASKFERLRGSLRTSRPDWRPRLYATTNPGGVGHAWFKRMFVSGQDANSVFFHATIDDNTFVNPEYRRYLDGLTGWLKRAWRHGDWDIQAGQYYTTWSDEHHVVEPFPVPTEWDVWLSMDYGWIHPTAILLLARDGEGSVYVVDEHVRSRWLPERHAEALQSALRRRAVNKDRVRRFVVGADAFARKGSDNTIADTYRDLGWPLTRANSDRITGATEILRRLGDPMGLDGTVLPARLFVFSHCRHLVEQLPAMQRDPSRPEDVLKVDADEDGQGGDDVYDALRYGIMDDVRRPGRRTRSAA